MGTRPCPRVSHRLEEGRRRFNAPVGEIISPRHSFRVYTLSIYQDKMCCFQRAVYLTSEGRGMLACIIINNLLFHPT